MNRPCHFDANQMGFSGTPIQQAQCLLRFVKRVGNVDDTPATLPPILTTLLSDPLTLGVTKSQLRSHLQKQGIAESTVGGPVTDRICHADSDNPSAPLARYFMIHDTSSKLKANESFDPAFINTAAWSGNRLSTLKRGTTHIYINRLGQTLTDNDYRTPFRATRFEATAANARFRGLFLHHELVQPRKGPGNTDPDSPDPGFTPAQYSALALQYVIASVRRGNWMVPAFHCVLDLHVGDHDDPQRFDLAAWDNALDQTLTAVRGERTAAPSMAMAVMAASIDFRTPAGRSTTKDGKGGSTTTGLQGSSREPAPGITVIEAVETITAFRDGRSLGAARAVRQVRTTNSEKTVVEQADYCWGRRSLPNAELVEVGQGLVGSGVFEGKATFFGKGDTEDEGTGGPVFGTVQTDSSVFGISLKKARMLDLGLLTEKNGVLKLSDKGARAIVEVFFPDTGRLVRLPLVDIGPANSGPAKTAVADLTVAATAFLQGLIEKDIRKLDNIVVQARVIA